MTPVLPLHRLLPLFFLGWLLVWQYATHTKSEATQQWVSTIVGGAAGGGLTGASTALDGEKYNRQLHQREIALIKANAKKFAKQKGISEQKALELLSQAALSGVDSYYARLKVDPDAKAFLKEIAGDKAFVKDAKGRTQHLFEETDRELYENHAVNANTIFDPNAQDIYKHSGYNTANIARSIANGGQLQGESARTQREFITHAVEQAKATGEKAYEDAAIRATIDARRNGVVSLSEIYDSKTPYAYAQDQNIKHLGQAVAVASVGNIKSNGNVLVRLTDGTTREVPAGAVVKGRDGRVYIRDKDSAANVANYEKYKKELFRAEGKPNVSDPKLQGFIDKLYRDNAKIGNGSTADAVRYELKTGDSVGGKYHSQKAQDSIKYLEKWHDKNPSARPSDRLEVEHLIKDMKDALNGK